MDAGADNTSTVPPDLSITLGSKRLHSTESEDNSSHKLYKPVPLSESLRTMRHDLAIRDGPVPVNDLLPSFFYVNDDADDEEVASNALTPKFIRPPETEYNFYNHPTNFKIAQRALPYFQMETTTYYMVNTELH